MLSLTSHFGNIGSLTFFQVISLTHSVSSPTPPGLLKLNLVLRVSLLPFQGREERETLGTRLVETCHFDNIQLTDVLVSHFADVFGWFAPGLVKLVMSKHPVQ